MTLYATPVVWLLFGLGALLSLKFQYLLISQLQHSTGQQQHSQPDTRRSLPPVTANLLPVAVALALSGANVVGYWKCQKGQSLPVSWAEAAAGGGAC